MDYDSIRQRPLPLCHMHNTTVRHSVTHAPAEFNIRMLFPRSATSFCITLRSAHGDYWVWLIGPHGPRAMDLGVRFELCVGVCLRGVVIARKKNVRF